MASSKASPTVPSTADNSDSPIELLSTARPGQTSGINRLPVELLHMIAWSLPVNGLYGIELGPSLWTDEEWDKLNKAKLAPRASDLYPLARTCKGFWLCLSPLLYHFDVVFSTTLFKLYPDPEDWCTDHGSSYSALSWGIDNNQMATVKRAVDAARSNSVLDIYAGTTRKRRCKDTHPNSAAVDDKRCQAAGAFDYADALFQAVLLGNAAAVRLVTEDADAERLNRPLHRFNFEYAYSASLARVTCNDFLTYTEPTLLQLAISLRHFDIVEVLLTRYSQLDESTLKWYEPIALPIAAYIGDVDMARLILDGTSSHSPWVARARSQLVDPRAYVDTGTIYTTHFIPQPPMLLAGEGMFRSGWCENGDEIFSLLAQRGGQDLLTKPSWDVDIEECITPLEKAIGCNLETREYPKHGPKDARVLALIKSGALTTRTHPIPSPPGAYPTRSHTIEDLWDFVDSSERLDFMGRCWDAALDHHGELDEEFVMYWADGVDYILDALAPPTYLHDKRAQQKAIDELERHVALISLLESKAPGFVQHPPIRNWLDQNVFRRSSRREINFTSLKGDWRHLM